MWADCLTFQGLENEIKKGTSQQGGHHVIEENQSEQWLSGWLRPPALEAGIESIKALNKQLGFSVLNQFVQWLKLVGRGALKACTHPLFNLSQSPGANALFAQRLSLQNGHPIRVISWSGWGRRWGQCLHPQVCWFFCLQAKCWLHIPHREGLKVL